MAAKISDIPTTAARPTPGVLLEGELADGTSVKMDADSFLAGKTVRPAWWLSGMLLSAPMTRHAGGGSAVTLTLNVLYLHPIFVPEDRTFTEVGFACQNGVAGAKARIGFWEADQFTREPGALILDCGDFSVATSGAKSFAISMARRPGIIWAGVVVDTAAVAIRGFAAGDCAALGVTVSGGNLYGIGGIQRPFTYGALDAESGETWTLGTTLGNPMIGIR